MADFVTNKPFLPILQNWKFFANVNFVSLRVNSCEKSTIAILSIFFNILIICTLRNPKNSIFRKSTPRIKFPNLLRNVNSLIISKKLLFFAKNLWFIKIKVVYLRKIWVHTPSIAIQQFSSEPILYNIVTAWLSDGPALLHYNKDWDRNVYATGIGISKAQHSSITTRIWCSAKGQSSK